MLDIRKKLCILGAARYWNKLPRQDVEVLLLNVFKFQGQVECGFRQPDLVVVVLAHGKVFGITYDL